MHPRSKRGWRRLTVQRPCSTNKPGKKTCMRQHYRTRHVEFVLAPARAGTGDHQKALPNYIERARVVAPPWLVGTCGRATMAGGHVWSHHHLGHLRSWLHHQDIPGYEESQLYDYEAHQWVAWVQLGGPIGWSGSNWVAWVQLGGSSTLNPCLCLQAVQWGPCKNCL